MNFGRVTVRGYSFLLAMLNCKNLNAMGIHRRLFIVYGEEFKGAIYVREWYRQFREEGTLMTG